VADRPRSSGDERPEPESLLDRYHLRDLTPAPNASDSSRPARGRLRVYLGMAAGVGKTYAMLNEGRRRKSRGTDVVVGWVETHGRALTQQQIGDLEIIPRKRIAYRGVELEEIDIDAVLARKPAVALVDELAHTNVPGARNKKRYQDVEELLAAGVTVITTVNIQHLESVNDVVETITSVRQRETIPDHILDEADEIELVDISPEALRARMRHGNVYPPERAQLALERYFSISNLTALRELALRRVSAKTEAQLEALMQKSGEVAASALRSAAVVERVMVAFDASPQTRRLLHEGWRLAHALRAPLFAVTVRSPQAGSGETGIADYARMAEDLGAEVIQPTGADAAETIARIARERGITLLIVGEPEQRRGWLPSRPSVVNSLLRQPLATSVLIVPRQRER
jgi:two-component system sensor histidine kinase KdpD